MLDKPQITQTAAQLTAIIRLTIPREEIRNNEELVQAGVMRAGEGLQPSAKGARLKFSQGKPTVIDERFSEAKELIAGYWLIQANSKQAAIEWARHDPYPFGAEAEIEIRQLVEASDFGAAFTPELREQEERMREHLLQSGK